MSGLPPLTRRRLLYAWLPLILCCYFGTLAVAARRFPVPYDWRYRVISNLLSPRDDPHWYRLPSFGIALAGLLMLPLASYLEARLRPAAQGWARFGRWSLSTGSALLVMAALVVPQHVHPVFGIAHLHETLARTAALGFGFAMLAFCWCARQDRRRTRMLDGHLLPLWAGLTLLPIAGILASELLLLVAREVPRWGEPIKDAMRHSVFWHLGFWEWAGSVAIFTFLTIAVWLLPESVEASDKAEELSTD